MAEFLLHDDIDMTVILHTYFQELVLVLDVRVHASNSDIAGLIMAIFE